MKYLGAPQSGSQANTTASHNRAGQYYRNRRSPVQPVGTGRRAFIRSSFGNASTAWAGLSGANQAAWIAYANSHPITDALGQSITLTGHQMFVAVATQLANVGAAAPTIPPVSSVVVQQVPTVFTVTHLGVITVTLPGTGAKVFLKVTPVNQYGVTGTPVIQSAVVS